MKTPLLLVFLMLTLTSITQGFDCAQFLSQLSKGKVSDRLINMGRELLVPESLINDLVRKATPDELRSVETIFHKFRTQQPSSLEDYTQLAAILKRHGAQHFLQFHTTVEGTIDKILTSQLDGQTQPHLRPGSYEWTVYALDFPANQSSLGSLRALSKKSQGKETVIFRGEAASLFQPHPATGLIPLYKYLNGERVVGLNQVVIDKYDRLEDGTLVVTKAHLRPLAGTSAVKGIIGAAMFHANELVLAGVAIFCFFNC